MISKKHFNTYPSRCFCKNPELIENYDLAIADKKHVWPCHHRKEEFYTEQELIEMGMYFNVSPDDLIFCKNKKEHMSLPHKGFENISKCQKGNKHTLGKTPWNKGKKGHLSNETLEKMSNASKGRTASEETKKKHSDAIKGRKWFTNGVISVMDYECPPGFVPGRIIHKH
jgi:hypothetical protein